MGAALAEVVLVTLLLRAPFCVLLVPDSFDNPLFSEGHFENTDLGGLLLLKGNLRSSGKTVS